MEFNHISDVVLKFIDKIDNQWRLFFASNLGITIWIFADNNTLGLFLTSIATVTYIAYSIVCYFSAVRAYVFLVHAMKELKLSIKEDTILSPELNTAISKLEYKSRTKLLMIAYFIAVGTNLFLFWRKILF